ncbi:ATP-binding protein [Streptomyces sp. NPDC008121]|uniref:ATP-binding protein n=1 Tax=Streptomyces sp. NPDC008121 TaxID=3364809 RepID=UPI0036E1272D
MMQPHDEAWSHTTTRTRTQGTFAGDSGGGGGVRTSADAREATRRRLARIRPVDRSQVDDLLLVVSELVANAERHAGGATEFRLDLGRDSVTVSVTDTSDEPPENRRGEALTPGGYGWPIVLRLCREVTVSVHEGGKTIRAVVPLEQ